MTTLVVGEAPGRSAPEGCVPLGSGRPLKRLSALAGLSEGEWLSRFSTTNLLSFYPGEEWPVYTARALAMFVPLEEYAMVILLGRRVADAFRIRTSWFDWAMIGETRVAVAPHPSGRSRWWNDPENVREAERFWRSVVGSTIPA